MALDNGKAPSGRTPKPQIVLTRKECNDFSTSTIEVPTRSGPGGVFDLQIVADDDLPASVRTTLIDSGV
jgi:hypothetical protein